MKITKKWLTSHKACCSEEDKRRAEKIGDPKEIVKKLINAGRYSDARWLVTRVLSKKHNVAMAVYAAEKALHSFLEMHPDDKRPRQAIDAAIAFLKNDPKDHKYTTDFFSYRTVAAANAASSAACALAATNADPSIPADYAESNQNWADRSVEYSAKAAAAYATALSEILYFGLPLEETT